MVKKFSVPESEIKHYVMPEITGNIVGMTEEALRPQTVEEIEALQKQAYDEARQAGFKKGIEEAALKAKNLQSALNFLQHPLKELDKQVEHQLADLAIALAKQLLKNESALDSQHIYTLVNESIEYLPVNARDIRVRLNPQDISLLNQAQIDTDKQSWKCIADNTLSAGGCVIESDTSHVDASVETRVQQLVDQLYLHQDGVNDEAE
ncbi:Flagellar assembly protein FliH [hydrothermal vent metagenome]|uniref:Flagellar assembly protein FliH n=1 Tax=hydrothermal vent metagenome TaxID=652676 RepID=A0A3B0YGH4_9ZZZZ